MDPTQLNKLIKTPVTLALNAFITFGIPGISIPNGLVDGLPSGFQLAGPAFSENRLLDAAHALEQALGFDATGAHV